MVHDPSGGSDPSLTTTVSESERWRFSNFPAWKESFLLTNAHDTSIIQQGNWLATNVCAYKTNFLIGCRTELHSWF